MPRFVLVLLAIIVLVPALLLGAVAFLLANPDYYRAALTERVEAASGFSVTINGEMNWRYLPPVALAVDDIEVRPRDSATPLARLASAEIDLALIPLIFSGEVSISALTFEGLTVDAVVDSNGRANWQVATDEATPSSTASAETSSSTLSLDISDVQIRNTVINYVDERAGSDYRIDVPRLETGRIVLGAPTEARFTTQIVDRATDMSVDIDGEGQLTLEEGFAGVAFNELAINQRLALPDRAPVMLDATLNGRYDIDASLLDTQLAGTLDGAAINGTATIEAADMTRVSFDLDIESIAGDKYVSQAETAAPASTATTEDVEVLPLESLRTLELDGAFNLGRLTYGAYELQNVAGTVTNRDDEITVESQANAYAGTVELRFTGTTAGNGAGQTRVTVGGLDLQALTDFEWITGTLALESSTTFTGSLLSDVLTTLDGPTTFEITDGTLDVTPIKKLAHLVDGLRGRASSVAKWPDKMPFEQLSGQHRFIAGAAADQEFAFALEVLEGRGKGGFDYFANQLEYDVFLSLLENDGPFGVGPGLARVAWPLHCQGPLDASPVELCLPDRGAIQQVVSGAAKQEIKRKGEELLREKLGDGLDKLFNRKEE